MTPVPFLLVWCFVVGACVGSFLNVVAWRLPSGMSLSWPGSHCPSCKKPILIRDNVPVFGWLWLRGRCRSCGQPISPRYPIVEFVTGAAFAVLAYPELVESGANLPWAQMRPRDLLVYTWLFHGLLTALLIAIALFELDGARAPRRFVAAGIASGLIPPLAFPSLYPVPISGLPPPLDIGGAAHLGAFEQLAIGLVGLACGAALGAALEFGCAGGRTSRMRGGLTLALGLCGAFLGWQAAVAIVCLVAIALATTGLPAAMMRRNLPRGALFVPAAAVIQIAGWQELSDLDWWPGPYTSGALLAGACVAVVVASAILTILGRMRRGS